MRDTLDGCDIGLDGSGYSFLSLSRCMTANRALVTFALQTGQFIFHPSSSGFIGTATDHLYGPVHHLLFQDISSAVFEVLI